MMACFRPGVMKSALKKRKRVSLENGEAAREGLHTPSKDKKVVQIGDGKSCEKVYGRADPDVDRTSIELPFHCDNCNHYILTNRYHCDKCADYDLCEKCFTARKAKNKRKCPHMHAAVHFSLADRDELFDEQRPNDLPGKAGGETTGVGKDGGREKADQLVVTVPAVGNTTPGGGAPNAVGPRVLRHATRQDQTSGRVVKNY